MNRNAPIFVFLLLVALAPVFLAVNQGVPTRFVTQQAVLLLSLAAFGPVPVHCVCLGRKVLVD